MKPVCDELFLIPFCDKSLQNAELLIIPWPITFRIMDDDIFVYIDGALFENSVDKG